MGLAGNDDDGVGLAEVVERGSGHVQVVKAATADGGKVEGVVGDDGAFVAQRPENRQRRDASLSGGHPVVF